MAAAADIPTVEHLADTSVLARMGKPAVAARLEPLILEGALATCAVIDLELLFSARSGEEHRVRRGDLDLRFRHVPIDERVLRRAIEVQGLLAERGKHRGVSIPDLIAAAAAECAGFTILHYDSDFDEIAAMTGQPTEWVVRRGSID